jgi:hypothetical protein
LQHWICNIEFAAPRGKPAKTPFSIIKQDENSHGAHGVPKIDVDVFEFAWGCLQVFQPLNLRLLQPVQNTNSQCTGVLILYFKCQNGSR